MSKNIVICPLCPSIVMADASLVTAVARTVRSSETGCKMATVPSLQAQLMFPLVRFKGT